MARMGPGSGTAMRIGSPVSMSVMVRRTGRGLERLGGWFPERSITVIWIDSTYPWLRASSKIECSAGAHPVLARKSDAKRAMA